MDKLYKNIPAETLASFARTTNPFGSITPEAAKAWEALAKSEKRHQERLRQVLPSRVAKAADEAAKANPEHRALFQSAYEEFEGCFGYVNGDPLVLSLLEEAMFILRFTPPDEETKAQLAKEMRQKIGRNGGLAKAKNAKEPEWWQHARAIYNSPKCPKKRPGPAAKYVQNHIGELTDFASKQEPPSTKQIGRVLFPAKRKKVGHPSS
jgi:hypothetical protein